MDSGCTQCFNDDLSKLSNAINLSEEIEIQTADGKITKSFKFGELTLKKILERSWNFKINFMSQASFA